ncbi:IS4 family transposase [Lactobacillus delbrueckii]|uniref:IS4 family transposase n=1 Tax=Lactobacillus delbrueckii TaxID=1584 RepID=UPI003A8A808B
MIDVSKLIMLIINMQSESIQKELFKNISLSGCSIAASAFVQAKAKLKPDIFRYIFDQLNMNLASLKLYNDEYRLFAIDGSDFNQVWNPKSENIVCFEDSNRKPYCQVHLNALYDLENKIYQDCVIQPKNKMDERKAAVEMLSRLECGKYIVLMDRGYLSFNMIQHCNVNKDCYYVIRSKTGFTAIKEISQLPDEEYDGILDCWVTTSNHFYTQNKDHLNIHLVNIHLVNHVNHQYKKFKSKNSKDNSWDFKQFCHVRFRVCKFRINPDDAPNKEQWEVLVTNLDADKFPLERMKELYNLRWGIEKSFKMLKYDDCGIQFHSKKDEFVKMELYAHLIAYNVIMNMVNQAYAPHPKSKSNSEYQINLSMAFFIVHFSRYWIAEEGL